ncbi:MAG TPA: glucose-6-phosphate dehydrogenase [Candidatus Saccharimonadales bacterium]|nr:glucose-6-phosphate dehydrogenase [Candidatus Saccharimonadales bacterium]
MTARPPQLEPSLIVIFGITGDLAQRSLLPALYHLIKDGLLPEQTEIVGVTRQAVSAEDLLNRTELCINEADGVCDPAALQQMHARTRLLQMDLTNEADYVRLLELLNAIEVEKGVCLNRLYYLSIPPQVYGPIVNLLGRAGLNASCQHGKAMTRLLIEKPFGYDQTSAQQLIHDTGQVFGEEQLYRIDHYLAKETVQNILTFRFENPIFESIWNQQHIEQIDISASEEIGIEGRALFYEPLGALRDFIQSHLLQLLAIVTMDQPTSLDSEHIHQVKHALLQQVQATQPDAVSQNARRGQYASYREEVGNPASMTETFAAIRVQINSDRWREVPIVLWSGKALAERKTEISVTFKEPYHTANNVLRFRIQPREGIELDLLAKQPGYDTQLQTAAMDFSYEQHFVDHGHPNAYERVLVDAVRGDHTLFATGPEVLEAWRIVQPTIEAWQKGSDDLQIYQSGTPGSALLDNLGNAG